MNWTWPLKNRPKVPTGEEPGAFGARRTHDIHTGVDLYCPNEPCPVYAVETGIVVYVGPFTGPLAGSPWWHDTNCVAVRSRFASTVLYGELEPSSSPVVGATVAQGELIGHVAEVLRRDKGRPTKMLHIELYAAFTEPVWWRLNETQPENLLDPTDLLLMARGR